MTVVWHRLSEGRLGPVIRYLTGKYAPDLYVPPPPAPPPPKMVFPMTEADFLAWANAIRSATYVQMGNMLVDLGERRAAELVVYAYRTEQFTKGEAKFP